MIVRKVVKCESCQEVYMLRYGVGLGLEQRLGWGCPYCHTEARAHFSVKNKEVDADFKSDDVEILDEELERPGVLGVNLYSELPTHQSSQGKGLDKGGSAWLSLMKFMGPGYGRYIEAKELMQTQRDHFYPMIRRAAAQYKQRNWIGVRDHLKLTSEEVDAALGDMHPAYTFSRVAEMLFIPVLTFDERIERGQELMDVLNDCRSSKGQEYKRVLTDMMQSQGFPESMVRCVDIFTRMFDTYDALLLPLATENFTAEWRDKLVEFRSFRDDFDSIKATYVDLFESMNQILLWIGMCLNLSRRGDVEHWSNGKKAKYSAARKWRSIDREFIIDELPKCKELVAKASRTFRNKIGHYSVRYNVVSGRLIFADGTDQNLLEFHEDYLATARLLSLLLTFCEKITLDHETEVLGAQFYGWKGKKK